MWHRHTQPPVSEIAIVYMGSMLFPWHFIGILWHPGGMLWNAMEFHGIQTIAIVAMVYMLFPWHFSGIIWHPGRMLWNAMKFHWIQKIAIVSMVSMLFPWHFSGILLHPCGMLWNAIEFHGIQKIFTVEIHGIWDSVKNWVYNTLECHEINSNISKSMLDLRNFHFVDHGVNWHKCTVNNICFNIFVLIEWYTCKLNGDVWTWKANIYNLGNYV